MVMGAQRKAVAPPQSNQTGTSGRAIEPTALTDHSTGYRMCLTEADHRALDEVDARTLEKAESSATPSAEETDKAVLDLLA